MERTYEAPSNEAPHTILEYHQGSLMKYPTTTSLLAFASVLHLQSRTRRSLEMIVLLEFENFLSRCRFGWTPLQFHFQVS